MRFTINGSPNDISASFSISQKENSSFLTIPLKKYMVDYVDERFLSIEIILNKFEGLKVTRNLINIEKI